MTRYADFNTPGKLRIFKSKAAKTTNKEYPLERVRAIVETSDSYAKRPNFKKLWIDPK